MANRIWLRALALVLVLGFVQATAAVNVNVKRDDDDDDDGGGGGDGDSGDSGSKTSPQKILIAHVSCGALATMLLFPLGVLLPRLARAMSVQHRWWFPLHAAINGLLGMGLVVAAFAIARTNFSDDGFMSTHNKLGLTLLILVLVQVTLGSVVHWWKGPGPTVERRGVLNVLHLVLGWAVVWVGFATVWMALDQDWATKSNLGPTARGVKIGFWVLVALYTSIYLVGLAFVPRQLKMERAAAAASAGRAPGQKA